MSYKQKAVEKLAEMEEGTRGIIAATIRLCIMVLKEIPEEYPKETLKETLEEDAWIPASEPPEKSGKVMICGVDNDGRIIYITDTNYSVRNKAFNCWDWSDDTDNALHPQYWKPKPKRVEDLRIRAPRE